MSELLDKQVDIENENLKIKIPRVHASPRKVCNENKRKTGWSDFDELRVTDSTLK